MRPNDTFHGSMKLLHPFVGCLLLVSLALNLSPDAYGAEGQNTDDSVLASVRTEDLRQFLRTATAFGAERQRLGKALLDVLQDPKSSSLNRCSAAYYLGEMRYPEAIAALAKEVTLQLDPRFDMLVTDYHLLSGPPAMEALVKIGAQAIPALMLNLETSEAPRRTRLSLRALCQIELDRDVVKFRLEKALKAQEDPRRRERLEAALRTLLESGFETR